MSRELRNFAILSLVCLFTAQVAPAQSERILDFHSEIEVRSDSSMVVMETIRVVSAQQQIRHGIYRDFPTRYTDRQGNPYIVGFNLQDASRDGAPESSRVEDYANGQRIYLGRGDFMVPPGEHTYTITYTTDRQIGFFKDHDELFWNATGNGWVFAIEHASATVRLPAKIPADEVRLGGYTGPQGSTAKALITGRNADGAFEFKTTQSLPPQNGLTILLMFPKGYLVAPPPPPPAAVIAPEATPHEARTYTPVSVPHIRLFAADGPSIAMVGAFILILFYYLRAWDQVGRDPEAGPIVVQYEPPPGFTPAAMRYLFHMGYDEKTFAAAITDMAVHGFLTIRHENDGYTLERTKADPSVLTPDEQEVAKRLFALGGTQIQLKKENHEVISSAIKALAEVLNTAENGIFFNTNGGYLLPALLFSVVMLIGIETVGGVKLKVSFYFRVALCAAIAKIMVSMATGLWESRRTVLAAFVWFVSFGCILAAWLLLSDLALQTSAVAAAALAGIIFLHFLFAYLLQAPTISGRKALDKVEGFRKFLGEVDRDRLNRADSGPTPEVFEKFLPFALALDVEDAWASKFTPVLASATQAPAVDSGYSPTWYSGSDWSSLGTAGLASSLAGSFSSAIASSSHAPGSSSGGGCDGGGGSSSSSGGGGGGGGGGGW